MRELANAAELFAGWRAAAGGNGQPAVVSSGADPRLTGALKSMKGQIITEALNIHQGRINEVRRVPANSPL